MESLQSLPLKTESSDPIEILDDEDEVSSTVNEIITDNQFKENSSEPIDIEMKVKELKLNEVSTSCMEIEEVTRDRESNVSEEIVNYNETSTCPDKPAADLPITDCADISITGENTKDDEKKDLKYIDIREDDKVNEISLETKANILKIAGDKISECSTETDVLVKQDLISSEIKCESSSDRDIGSIEDCQNTNNIKENNELIEIIDENSSTSSSDSGFGSTNEINNQISPDLPKIIENTVEELQKIICNIKSTENKDTHSLELEEDTPKVAENEVSHKKRSKDEEKITTVNDSISTKKFDSINSFDKVSIFDDCQSQDQSIESIKTSHNNTEEQFEEVSSPDNFKENEALNSNTCQSTSNPQNKLLEDSQKLRNHEININKAIDYDLIPNFKQEPQNGLELNDQLSSLKQEPLNENPISIVEDLVNNFPEILKSSYGETGIKDKTFFFKEKEDSSDRIFDDESISYSEHTDSKKMVSFFISITILINFSLKKYKKSLEHLNNLK